MISMLKNGYYAVVGHNDTTYGLINNQKWVGVKITNSLAEWVAVNGQRALEICSEASNNSILEAATGTGAIAMGPGGPGYKVLPAKKKKTESKKDDGQVILGDTDESETHGESVAKISTTPLFVSKLEAAITDGLIEKRRHFCNRCKHERTFAEAEGDMMRCIVCTHSLYRADSHFSIATGKKYTPPAAVKAIHEGWRPGMDIPEDIDPSLLAKVVQAADPTTGTGAVGVNSRLKTLKNQENSTKNKIAKKKETDEQLNQLKKKLDTKQP